MKAWQRVSFFATLMPVLLGLSACGGGGDLTANFVGNWSLTSGTYTITCGTMSTPNPHSAGDIVLAISPMSDNVLGITLTAYSNGQQGPSCNMSAMVTSDSTATPDAQSCKLAGSPYNFVNGSIAVTNQTMALDLTATFMMGSMTCQESDTSTLAPK